MSPLGIDGNDVRVREQLNERCSSHAHIVRVHRSDKYEVY
jgi:hypothetical protein